jgi:hypothetical protein
VYNEILVDIYAGYIIKPNPWYDKSLLYELRLFKVHWLFLEELGKTTFPNHEKIDEERNLKLGKHFGVILAGRSVFRCRGLPINGPDEFQPYQLCGNSLKLSFR